MGEGKHSRFSLHSGSHRALGVAFGRPSLGVEDDESVDAAVRLEVNHWNGSVEPRVVLNELYPLEDGETERAEVRLHACECSEDEWWQRFEAELARDLDFTGAGANLSPLGYKCAPSPMRGRSSAATPRSRWRSRSSCPAAPGCSRSAPTLRVGPPWPGVPAASPASTVAPPASPARVAAREALDDLGSRAAGGLALTDYATLLRAPEDVAARFEHVVLVDPAPSSQAQLRAGMPRQDSGESESGAGAGFLHPLWSEAEVAFSVSVLDEGLASREAVATLFRSLREAGEASGEELREALRGGGTHRRSPEAAARCFRVLAELGLVSGEPDRGVGAVGVVSSKGTDLERSAAFRAYRADHSEAATYLERPKQQ